MGVDYYAVLDVQRTADLREIRKGYARTAIRCHPERPYPECPPDDFDLRLNWFQLAGEAYEVLSNPFLRAAYDKFGEAGLKNGVPARDPELFSPPYSYHSDALKTYREFFGTESASEPMLLSWQTHFEPRRPDGEIGPWFREKPEEVTLPLTLEKVMQGGQVEAVMMRRELVNGSIVVNKHRIPIDLQPGTPCGSSFLFPKQGHQAPYSIPGDVLVVTKDLPHPIFSREKHDLVVYCRVNLAEALLGCSVQVPTLDGRLLRINVTDIVSPDYELRIPGEGMPICAPAAPPSPLELPSRKCYLQVPSWVKESGADLPGKIGPCSTCGQTSDCCDVPGTSDLSGSCRSLFPSIHPCSNCGTTLKVSISASPADSRRESRSFSLCGEGRKGRHASFDAPEVESARQQMFLEFPELFDEGAPENGDLVIRFKIVFPKHLPGNRRELMQNALDGMVDVPERRVIYNRKY